MNNLKRPLATLVVVACLALAATSCGGGDDDASPGTDGKAESPVPSGGTFACPPVESIQTATGLDFEEITKGVGPGSLNMCGWSVPGANGDSAAAIVVQHPPLFGSEQEPAPMETWRGDAEAFDIATEDAPEFGGDSYRQLYDDGTCEVFSYGPDGVMVRVSGTDYAGGSGDLCSAVEETVRLIQGA